MRLNSASEMPAFFASSFDICLSPLKSIFLKLYFLTTIGFTTSGDGIVPCEKPVIGNKHIKTVAILLNFIFESLKGKKLHQNKQGLEFQLKLILIFFKIIEI